jgi:methanogenic corrinoid protein MtbC1
MSGEAQTRSVTARSRKTSAGMLSIGALARATGIAVETLRTWERRYGYPGPSRKPSGHRVYPTSSVPRLRRIAEALTRGHRAGEVLTASEEDLTALLHLAPSGAAERMAPDADVDRELLRAIERFDSERLTRLLMAEWGRLGPLEFVRTRVAPLLTEVGDGWAAGRLEVRHEHFFSERLSDVLRTLRLPLEERARGPLVVFATLPGELHGLGLQMAALVLVTAGCRICYLGTDVPLPELATLARDLAARAVAISVSAAGQARSGAQLKRLRELLSRRVALLVGGQGAGRARPGIEVLQDLAGLVAWGDRLAQGAA